MLRSLSFLLRRPRLCNVRYYMRRTIETVKVDYFPAGETQARWIQPPVAATLVQRGSVLGVLEAVESKVTLDVTAPVSGMLVSTTEKEVVSMDDVVASIDTNESDDAWLERHLKSNNGELGSDFLKELVNRDNNYDRLQAIAITLREGFPQHHDTALKILRRIRERHGGDPLRQASIDADTGLLYQKMGDLDSALKYLQQTVNLRKQQSLDESTYARTTADVEEVYTEEGQKNILLVIEDIFLLAGVRRSRGELSEAQSELEHCLQLQSTVLDGDHPIIANTHFNLGSIAWERGLTSDARNHYAIALDSYEKRWPEGHEDSANTHHMLAVIAHHDGDWEEAPKHAEKVIAIRKVVLGERHPDTALAHQTLAQILTDIGVDDMPARAIAELKRANDIQKEHYGEVHEVPADTLAKVGAICCVAKQYDEALEHFHAAVEINEKLGNKAMTASLFSNIGIVHKERGELDVAQVYNQKAYNLIAKQKSTAQQEQNSAEQTAAILADMGNVYKRQHRFQEALLEHERAHALLIKTLGPKHPDVASSWSNLGELHAILGNYQIALDQYNNALDTTKSLVRDQETHPQIAACLYNIGLIHKKSGALEIAKKTLEKARDIWALTLGGSHAQTLAAKELIASLSS